MQEHIYKLQIECLSPKNPNVQDVYQAKIVTDTMIVVEELQTAIRDMTAEPMYQEALTEAISTRFRADVTLEGEHAGVKVTSHCWLQAMPSPTQMGPVGR